jgi:hypothetical protein
MKKKILRDFSEKRQDGDVAEARGFAY